MFPATFLNFGPACSAIFLLWSFGEINQLELSNYLDINAYTSFLSKFDGTLQIELGGSNISLGEERLVYGEL